MLADPHAPVAVPVLAGAGPVRPRARGLFERLGELAERATEERRVEAAKAVEDLGGRLRVAAGIVGTLEHTAGDGPVDNFEAKREGSEPERVPEGAELGDRVVGLKELHEPEDVDHRAALADLGRDLEVEGGPVVGEKRQITDTAERPRDRLLDGRRILEVLGLDPMDGARLFGGLGEDHLAGVAAHRPRERSIREIDPYLDRARGLRVGARGLKVEGGEVFHDPIIPPEKRKAPRGALRLGCAEVYSAASGAAFLPTRSILLTLM